MSSDTSDRDGLSVSHVTAADVVTLSTESVRRQLGKAEKQLSSLMGMVCRFNICILYTLLIIAQCNTFQTGCIIHVQGSSFSNGFGHSFVVTIVTTVTDMFLPILW